MPSERPTLSPASIYHSPTRAPPACFPEKGIPLCTAASLSVLPASPLVPPLSYTTAQSVLPASPLLPPVSYFTSHSMLPASPLLPPFARLNPLGVATDCEHIAANGAALSQPALQTIEPSPFYGHTFSHSHGVADWEERVKEEKGLGQRTIFVTPNMLGDTVSTSEGGSHDHTLENATAAPTSEESGSDETPNPLVPMMRPSMNVPATEELLRTSGLLFGVVLSPLAALGVPLVPVDRMDDLVRCGRCRGYINLHVQWSDDGRRWRCNLCPHSNDSPEGYVCRLGRDGMRLDAALRPELSQSMVEYVFQSLEKPMRTIYLIDTSADAAPQLSFVMRALQGAFRAAAEAHVCRYVSFITYGSALRFYDFRLGPKTYVVPDVEDPFIPLPFDEHSWLSLDVDVEQICAFLERVLDETARTPPELDACLGSALEAARLVLGRCGGGRAVVIATARPARGLGGLPPEGSRDAVTPERATAEAYWRRISKSLAEGHIAVDLYWITAQPVELALICQVSHATGGDVLLLRTMLANEAERLQYAVFRSLTRQCGYNAVLRTRCSPGLRVEEYFGHFSLGEGYGCQAIDLAGIDEDKALFATLAHDGALDAGPASVQCAIMYTCPNGERRLRIHTTTLPVESAPKGLFNSADLAATLTAMIHRSICEVRPTSVMDKALTKVSGVFGYLHPHGTATPSHTILCDMLCHLLAQYRLCGGWSAHGQLTVPESLKQLPAYVNALMKSPLFNESAICHPEARVADSHRMKGLQPDALLSFAMPRLFAIHIAPQSVPADGFHDSTIPVKLAPSAEPLARHKLYSNGVYALHDVGGGAIWIYLGPAVDSHLLRGVFGVARGADVQDDIIDTAPAPLSAFISWLRRGRLDGWEAVSVVHAASGEAAERCLLQRLVEDAVGGAVGYTEFVSLVQRRVNRAGLDSASGHF